MGRTRSHAPRQSRAQQARGPVRCTPASSGNLGRQKKQCQSLRVECGTVCRVIQPPRRPRGPAGRGGGVGGRARAAVLRSPGRTPVRRRLEDCSLSEEARRKVKRWEGTGSNETLCRSDEASATLLTSSGTSKFSLGEAKPPGARDRGREGYRCCATGTTAASFPRARALLSFVGRQRRMMRRRLVNDEPSTEGQALFDFILHSEMRCHVRTRSWNSIPRYSHLIL